MVAVRVAQLAAQNDGKRLNGRQAWPLLWASSKPLSYGVIAWAAPAATTGEGVAVVALLLGLAITKRSEEEMSAQRRLAGMIFELSSNAAAAGELRSYGLSGHLAGLHARLTESC